LKKKENVESWAQKGRAECLTWGEKGQASQRNVNQRTSGGMEKREIQTGKVCRGEGKDKKTG